MQASLKESGYSERANFPGGGTPYDGLYGEAPPERGTFFSLQVYEKVEISNDKFKYIKG